MNAGDFGRRELVNGAVALGRMGVFGMFLEVGLATALFGGSHLLGARVAWVAKSDGL